MSHWSTKSGSDEQPAGPEGSESGRSREVEDLFREHNDALLRFLRARVGSFQEAREVAQEAYVRLLSLDQPGAVSYLRAFLFKTAANIAIDRRRRNEVHTRAVERPLFEEWVDTLTPDRRLAGQQTLRHLERLVAALPPKCQQAFVLSQVYGVGFGAIARQMGISESMVRKYVTRALVHCRSRLDEEGGPGGGP